MNDDKANGKVPFYLSRKFWMELVAAGIYLSLSLTETVVFSPWQHVIMILGLAGIAVGGHTVTDVGSMVTQAILARRNGGAPPPPPAPAVEPELEPKPDEEETEVEIDDADEDEEE